MMEVSRRHNSLISECRGGVSMCDVQAGELTTNAVLVIGSFLQDVSSTHLLLPSPQKSPVAAIQEYIPINRQQNPKSRSLLCQTALEITAGCRPVPLTCQCVEPSQAATLHCGAGQQQRHRQLLQPRHSVPLAAATPPSTPIALAQQ
jgi:hypothetical protein